MNSRIIPVLKTIGRLITFRLTREDFLQFNMDHLAVGIFCTWLVGIGRTLHNSRVEWWQHLGLGSVAYIFVLALLLWLLLLPLRIQNLSYRHILTFISLTSPTGFIYAIPVESFISLDSATTARFWFLGFVALWRVALWVFYLKRFCMLSGFGSFVAGILPLCFIVTLLTMLNLDKVVFNIMGGRESPSTDDGAYLFLVLITQLAILAFIPLVLMYIAIIYQKWIKPRA